MSKLQEAAFDKRAAALFIDLALRVLSFFVLAGAGFAAKSVPLLTLAPLSLIASIAFFALTDAVLLTWRGQTIGKRIVGIYVARPDGSRAPFMRIVLMRSILPAVLALLPYFGMLWLFLDHLWALGPERRAVHDHLADTAVFVAQRQTNPSESPRTSQPRRAPV